MKSKSESMRRGASPRRPNSRTSHRGGKRHRLPAHVTGEDDWEVEVPQIRMSRAFAVMLLLHLVAVGGLIAFHMYGRDDQDPADAAAKPAPAKQGRSSGGGDLARPSGGIGDVAAPRAEVLPEKEPGNHTVSKGETPNLVAARYGISVLELNEANPGVKFAPGASLVIPQHQRVISAPAIAPVEPEVDLFTPAEDAVRTRAFAVKAEPESPPLREVVPAATAARERTGASNRRETTGPAAASTREAKPPRAIPVAEPAPKTASADPARKAAARSTGSRTHVVGKGDTLYSIAKKYKLSGDEIARANGITDASKLRAGQVLTIPRS